MVLFFYSLSISQVDLLWDTLASADPASRQGSDDLFLWLGGQVRARDQHALTPATLRHILLLKLPSLPPSSVSMHSLALFQQLCNLLVRLGGEDSGSSMDYLWRVGLYAGCTDVSLAAIQYLNNYYIGRGLDKEEEFVER